MELVAVLRVLWRFRLAVVAGFVLAAGLGFLTTRGATTHQGVASTRVLLDTPRSQTVEANSKFGPSLEWRAALLGDLMSSDSTHVRLARQMGIDADNLVVRAPHLSVPPVAAQLPRHALDAGSVVTEPYELAIQAVPKLPIISIDTRAPSREKAARLAASGAQAVMAKADEATTPGGRFVVEELAPIRTRVIENGPRKAIAVTVTLVVFAVWCAAITLIAGLRHRRRALRAYSRTITQPVSG